MTLNAYQSLYFQLEDSTGNVLLTKTGKFGPTNSLAQTNFYVEFLKNTSGGDIAFRPRLQGIGIASSYNIALNIKSDDDLNGFCIIDETDGGNVYLDEDNHYFWVDNNKHYLIMKNFFKSSKIQLEFLIFTRTSKTLVLKKTYDFNLTSTETQWTGGTVEEGNQNFENNYYNKTDMDVKQEQNNSNSSSDINTVIPGVNDDINVDNIKNFSFDDILKMCSHGFETFKILFSMLPSFVWGLMTTFIIICIILRLIGK